MEKKFKPFDKVLVRDHEDVWHCDIYSHYNENAKGHVTLSIFDVSDIHILPYEGNEHLVGTTDYPDEEVRLEEGELIFVDDTISDDIVLWNFTRFAQVSSSDSFATKFGNIFKYAIRFSDFNPNDMVATKAKILCVKNGKVVRYKG